MRTSIILRTFLAVLSVGAGGGQLCGAPPDDSSGEPQLSGPVLGYVLDAGTQSIRPIHGIPGAGRLGSPLALPFSIAAATFSSRGDFALAVAAVEDRPLYVVRNLGSATPSLYQLEGAIGGADRLVLNAGNTAAVALASGIRQLQIIRGLPNRPIAGPPLDLGAISGKITALALDGAARNVLVGVEGSLYRISIADGGPGVELVAGFASPTAIAFLHQDQDLLVADGGVNQLALIRHFLAGAEVSFLAGERDGVSGPVGLQVSPNGRQAFLANQGTRSLDVWDLEARSLLASLPLDAAPSRLVPLDAGPTFLLNEVGDDPLLVLEAGDTPAVYFVPAGRER